MDACDINRRSSDHDHLSPAVVHGADGQDHAAERRQLEFHEKRTQELHEALARVCHRLGDTSHLSLRRGLARHLHGALLAVPIIHCYQHRSVFCLPIINTRLRGQS